MPRVFRALVPRTAFILLISELLLLIFCYVLAAFLVLAVDPVVFLVYGGGFARILLPVLAILFGMYFFGLYADVGARFRAAQMLEIGQAIGLAFIVEAFLSYASREWMIPRRLMVSGGALSLACLAGWRALYTATALRGVGQQRVLFVGATPVIQAIAAYLESHPEAGITPLGYAADGLSPGQVLHGAPVLGPLNQARQIAGLLRPDRIVVGERRDQLPVEDLLELKFAGTSLEEAATTYENLCGRVSLKQLRTSQLVFSGEWAPSPERVMLQSAYSAGMALVGALLALPVMLLIAVAVRVTSWGPVLCRQTRVGLGGRVFLIYQFRSTYAEAEESSATPREGKHTPGVTPLGRWLRRFRLDKLPQLFNVLRGEMSLVGPRPERPEFVEVLAGQIPYYHQRHCVKPGLTGWAQVNCRPEEKVEDASVNLEYDLYYLKHLSPALDGYILFQTLRKLLRRSEAEYPPSAPG